MTHMYKIFVCFLLFCITTTLRAEDNEIWWVPFQYIYKTQPILGIYDLTKKHANLFTHGASSRGITGFELGIGGGTIKLKGPLNRVDQHPLFFFNATKGFPFDIDVMGIFYFPIKTWAGYGLGLSWTVFDGKNVVPSFAIRGSGNLTISHSDDIPLRSLGWYIGGVVSWAPIILLKMVEPLYSVGFRGVYLTHTKFETKMDEINFIQQLGVRLSFIPFLGISILGTIEENMEEIELKFEASFRF